jgi:hypothetical protein
MDRKHLKNMTDEELMVAELLRIIRAERSKPQGDEEAVRDCLDQIAEITGIPRDEVEYTVELKVKEQQTQNRRKKLSRILAGIAVSVAVVMGITACSVNPVFLNWLRTIVRMPVGTSVEEDGITYYCYGDPVKVDSVYDFVELEKISILYPTWFPNNVKLKKIFQNADNKYIFVFSSSSISFAIQLDVKEGDLQQQEDNIVELDCGKFAVVDKDGHFHSVGIVDGCKYYLECSEYNDLISVISSMERIE